MEVGRWWQRLSTVCAAVLLLVHTSRAEDKPTNASEGGDQGVAEEQKQPESVAAEEDRPRSEESPPDAAATEEKPPAESTEPSASEPQTGSADEKPVEELLEELIVPDEPGSEADSDLMWLYSDEIYEPSDLGGRSIPVSALPESGEGAPRVWDPHWRRFETSDYIVAGSALAFTIGGNLLPPDPARWAGRNSLDESVRDAIGLKGLQEGVWARDVSDVGLSFLISYPLLVDSLVVTYWYRASPDVAKEMALVGAEALLVTAALQGIASGLASRERPYVRNCDTPEFDGQRDCDGSKPYRSFFSGHTSLSFAGAGAACVFHAYHDVFGGGYGDDLACGAAIAAATTVGVMRVVGDQHYFSDVATGAAIGLLSGIGVPWLLHYGPLARQKIPVSGSINGVEWRLVALPNLVAVGGIF